MERKTSAFTNKNLNWHGFIYGSRHLISELQLRVTLMLWLDRRILLTWGQSWHLAGIVHLFEKCQRLLLMILRFRHGTWKESKVRRHSSLEILSTQTESKAEVPFSQMSVFKESRLAVAQFPCSNYIVFYEHDFLQDLHDLDKTAGLATRD